MANLANISNAQKKNQGKTGIAVLNPTKASPIVGSSQYAQTVDKAVQEGIKLNNPLNAYVQSQNAIDQAGGTSTRQQLTQMQAQIDSMTPDTGESQQDFAMRKAKMQEDLSNMSNEVTKMVQPAKPSTAPKAEAGQWINGKWFVGAPEQGQDLQFGDQLKSEIANNPDYKKPLNIAGSKLSSEIGNISSEDGPTPEQQRMIDAVEKFNLNFNMQSKQNDRKAQEEAKAKMNANQSPDVAKAQGMAQAGVTSTGQETGATGTDQTAMTVPDNSWLTSTLDSLSTSSFDDFSDGNVSGYQSGIAGFDQILAAGVAQDLGEIQQLKSDFSRLQETFLKSKEASLASLHDQADQTLDYVTEAQKNQDELAKIQQDETDNQYADQIEKMEMNNAAIMGQLAGKYAANGMMDSAAGLQQLAKMQAVLNKSLGTLTTSRANAQKAFIVSSRQSVLDYDNTVTKIQQSFNDAVNKIESDTQTNIMTAYSDTRKGVAAQQKDILSLLKEGATHKEALDKQKKDDMYKAAQLEMEKMKYDHSVVMDAADLALKQDANRRAFMDSTISNLKDMGVELTTAQKKIFLEQMGGDLFFGGNQYSSIGNPSDALFDQCAYFSNRATTGPKVSSSWESKIGKADLVVRKGTAGAVASVDQEAIQPGNTLVIKMGDPTIGHTAVVTKYDASTGTISVVERNRNGDGQTTEGSYSIANLTKNYGEWGVVKTQFTPEMNSLVNQSIFFDDQATPESEVDAPVDPMSRSILAQTGLSIPAFTFLVQGTTALTRMTPDQRLQYMNEAEDWANKQGIDISTFKSQFKAYNDVVERNIGVAAKTDLAAQDIKISLDSLAELAKTPYFSGLKVANVARVWAGQQINDKTATQYAFNLEDMKSALAYFFAAQRGNNMTDDADLEQADKVIKNGLSSGSIQGLQETITSVADRYSLIAKESVNKAQEGMWNLFGVGGNYAGTREKPKGTTPMTRVRDKATGQEFDYPGNFFEIPMDKYEIINQ
jgi:hypothetical protein